MKLKFLSDAIFAVIFLLVQLTTYGQVQIGKFIESADCPLHLRDGLVIGENFKIGYVDVLEFHNLSTTKKIILPLLFFHALILIMLRNHWS